MSNAQIARGVDQLEIWGSAQKLERTVPGQAERQEPTHEQVQ